ncbi:MAG: AMP-binding protein [Verrucomicrobiaceae bacterium]
MTAFLTPTFWNNVSAHVALPPGVNAEGLQAFVEARFPNEGTCLFQTSGTEGAPKWVVLTKDGVQRSAKAVNAHFGITADDRWLLALPLWHVGGFGILARAYAAGCEVTTLEGKWDAQAFAELATGSKSTLTSLVPTQVFDLVTARLKAPASMRVVLVGGAALSADLEKAALDLGWPIRRTYGMTETASQVASQSVAGGDLEVLSLWDLQTDSDGILTIRGPALAKGYIHRDESKSWSWAEISATEGLRTRDRVSLSEVGGKLVLRFTGREAGTIKILGEFVSLSHIQERLEGLRLALGISHGDAAVCDMPDERAGARLVLAFSNLPPADAERLMNALNDGLRAFEKIHQAREVPSIPRGELGKLRLEPLRALLNA